MKTIKGMYSDLKSSVRVNNLLTGWFSVEKGLQQGDNLAPTLFALYVNDLIPEINYLGCGIALEGETCISKIGRAHV